MLAAAVAVLGLQAPLPVSRVAQSRLGGVRMASDEPWFEDCVSTTSIDKSAFECAAPPQSTWPCSNWHGRLAAAIWSPCCARYLTNGAPLPVAIESNWARICEHCHGPGDCFADSTARHLRAAYATAMNAPAPAASTSGKQDFLEASPFWDQSNIPINTCVAQAV